MVENDDDASFSGGEDAKESQSKKTPNRYSTWDEKFQALIAYKKEHGHCNVPQNYKPDRQLAIWVKQLRGEKRDRLTSEQKKCLDELGFDWETLAQKQERVWNERFQELKAFYEIHDHCRVKQASGVLGTWVMTQRKNYQNGKLRKDYVQKLESIEFEWVLRKPVERKTWTFRHKWIQCYEKLVQFQKEHGHCIVRQNDEKHQKLAWWVRHQRRKFLAGELTNERIGLLDQIGFVWNVPEHNREKLPEHNREQQQQREEKANGSCFDLFYDSDESVDFDESVDSRTHPAGDGRSDLTYDLEENPRKKGKEKKRKIELHIDNEADTKHEESKRLSSDVAESGSGLTVDLTENPRKMGEKKKSKLKLHIGNEADRKHEESKRLSSDVAEWGSVSIADLPENEREKKRKHEPHIDNEADTKHKELKRLCLDVARSESGSTAGLPENARKEKKRKHKVHLGDKADTKHKGSKRLRPDAAESSRGGKHHAITIQIKDDPIPTETLAKSSHTKKMKKKDKKLRKFIEGYDDPQRQVVQTMVDALSGAIRLFDFPRDEVQAQQLTHKTKKQLRNKLQTSDSEFKQLWSAVRNKVGEVFHINLKKAKEVKNE